MIGSLDFLSDSGHLRAITTTGVVITTPQSWDSRYATLTQHDGLAGQVALNEATRQTQSASFAAQLGQAQNDIVSLENRVAALEAAQLTFLSAQGGTPVPVHQIQIAPDLKFAYYHQSKILWIQQDDPLPSDPYD